MARWHWDIQKLPPARMFERNNGLEIKENVFWCDDETGEYCYFVMSHEGHYYFDDSPTAYARKRTAMGKASGGILIKWDTPPTPEQVAIANDKKAEIGYIKPKPDVLQEADDQISKRLAEKIEEYILADGPIIERFSERLLSLDSNRQGDILETKGAAPDPSIPNLYQHVPFNPPIKHKKESWSSTSCAASKQLAAKMEEASRLISKWTKKLECGKNEGLHKVPEMLHGRIRKPQFVVVQQLLNSTF